MNQTDKFSLARIPGQHIPTFVLRALRALYPTVRIVWNYDALCWQMIERMRDGRWGNIMLMQDAQGRSISPNLHNTVGLLQSIDSARMRSAHDIDQFLAGLDKDREDAKARREQKARDTVRPVGEAFWDAMAGKIRVPVQGTRRPRWRRS